MGTHVLLCFCIKQAETARTREIWAEKFLQNQYGSEVKTTPFELALTWVSFITEVRLCDGSTLSLVDWLVLASSNGFIQEVCVVYLHSLVTVRFPGLKCLRNSVSWGFRQLRREKERQRNRDTEPFHLTLLILDCVKWCNWRKCVLNINCLWRECYKFYTVFVTCAILWHCREHLNKQNKSYLIFLNVL